MKTTLTLFVAGFFLSMVVTTLDRSRWKDFLSGVLGATIFLCVLSVIPWIWGYTP